MMTVSNDQQMMRELVYILSCISEEAQLSNAHKTGKHPYVSSHKSRGISDLNKSITDSLINEMSRLYACVYISPHFHKLQGTKLIRGSNITHSPRVTECITTGSLQHVFKSRYSVVYMYT